MTIEHQSEDNLMTFYNFITAVKQEVGIKQLTQEQASLLMQNYYLKGKTSESDIVRAAKDITGDKK